MEYKEKKQSLIVIGNGMSGSRTIENLLKITKDQYNITIFGEEPHFNYNRIMLSYLLSGKKTFDNIVIHKESWYEENNITLHKGDKVISIDRVKKIVTSQSGKVLEYDKLLISTGSSSFIPQTKGSELQNVIGFRTKNDSDIILESISKDKTAVVVGGGLLGLEAAYGIAHHGVKTILVHRSDSILTHQLDSVGGKLLQKKLESFGIEFKLSATIEEIMGIDAVEKVSFTDGTTVETNLVVFATGITPNIDLAKEISLEVNKGIIVNDYLQTSDDNIFAIAECSEHNGKLYGLVPPLYEQAKFCAMKLADQDSEGYKGSTLSTRLKISGVSVFSAGDYLGDETTEALIALNEQEDTYKKLVVRDNKIVGIILYGDTLDASWYLKFLKEETDIGDLKSKILEGKSVL